MRKVRHVGGGMREIDRHSRCGSTAPSERRAGGDAHPAYWRSLRPRRCTHWRCARVSAIAELTSQALADGAIALICGSLVGQFIDMPIGSTAGPA